MIRRMSIVDVDCPRTRRRGRCRSASAATLFFAARHRFQRVLAVFGVDLYGLDLFGVSWPLGSLVPGDLAMTSSMSFLLRRPANVIAVEGL